MKKVSHIFEYLLVATFSLLIYPIAFSQLDRLAAFIVFIFWPILGGARKRIKYNIKNVFPDMTEKEKNKFCRNSLRHALRVSLEITQAHKFTKKSFYKKYINPTSTKAMLELLNQSERALVCIEGHFGNWEIPVALFGNHGVSFTVSAKRQSNPYVDKMIDRRRKNYGCEIAYLEESGNLAKKIKKGENIGLVADQDAGASGVFAQFMGKKASTYTGPAVLTYLAKTTLYLFVCVFQGRGRYKIDFFEVGSALSRDDYDGRDDAIEKLTQGWVNILEREVYKDPEQYFWVHRRWKSRPIQTQKDYSETEIKENGLRFV